MLSEKGQSQKATYGGFPLYEMSGIGELLEMDWWLPGASWGQGWSRE